MNNPFVTTGYAGAAYFCDREKETNDIVSLLTNGNNLALISPRRIGKTDLLRHCLSQPSINEKYHTFIVDIYATQSLSDFVYCLGKKILEELKPKGKRALSSFINMLSSIKAEISYDASGLPSFSASIGELANPKTTLDEIFTYLQQSDKPCIVVIDEFQQITKYKDGNLEALLRTYVQYCSNAQFVFSGSHRHLMGTLFTSPTRPFYQSVTLMSLPLINREKYIDFCRLHFEHGGKIIDSSVVDSLYDQFDGVTFYLQKVMNILYMRTNKGERCTLAHLQPAIDYIVDFTSNTYADLLYQLPYKQKKILMAISAEGNAEKVTSGAFAKKYGLVSPSSISSALKGLLEKDLITSEKGVYQVYDKFFAIWLRRVINE